MTAKRRSSGEPQDSARRSAAAALVDDVFGAAPLDSVADIVKVTRRYLDMEVAFVSEFVGDRRVFRYIDPPDSAMPRRDSCLALDEGYCKRIVDGTLPELMPDTAAVTAAAALGITQAVPIGSHVGVPIRLRDQRLYGTFCCFSGHADPTLNGRDLRVMHAFADLVAHQIDRALDAERSRTDLRRSVEAAIEGANRSIVFQPIVHLPDGRIVGVEGLSRFGTPQRGPDVWFADADGVGLLPDLECAAIRSALTALPHLPAGVYLALNVSPMTMLDDRFGRLFDDVPPERIVIEVTEHADVPDYAALAERLAPLRRRRLRLAVDDAGAGYASLQHILNLRPDIIKLDMSLTRNVDTDPARRSLAAALVSFAAGIGCQLVAEGIETDAELQTLRAFGVTMAQGYRLGRPMPLGEVLRYIDHAEWATAASGRR